MTTDMLIQQCTSWLLTYAIHSTILILAVWLVVRGIPPLARQIGPRGENLAWKFALVGGLISASVQVGAGIHPAFGALEFGEPEPIARAQPVEKTERAASVTRRMHPLGRLEADIETLLVTRDSLLVIGGGGRPGFASMPLASAPPMMAMAPVEPGPAPLWPKVVFGLALFGAALALIRLGLCIRGLQRKLGDRSEVLVDPALEQFLILCRDAQIDRKVRLTHSGALGSPIALGRREIVLPTRALDELSPAALRSVLAHELAHLERHDPTWLLFAAVIEALCFFQPLNRLARRGMQESAELLCDDWAIAQTHDGLQFAKSLAELAGWSHRMQPSALLAGMISGERPLVRRVRRALDADPRRLRDEGPQPARLLLGLGALAALVMLAPGAVDASPPEAEADKPSKREQTRIETKIERRIERAEDRAERARAKAERAREQADAAERAAREAEREAARLTEDEHAAAPSVVIRDGDEFLIIDEHGVRAGDGEDRVEIDEQRIRILHDGHAIELPIGDMEGMRWEDFGRALGDLRVDGLPSGQPGVFDPEEFGHSLDELDDLGDRIEREVRERVLELDDVEDVLRLLDEGQAPPRPPAPPRPGSAVPAPPAPPAPPPAFAPKPV